MNQFTLAIGFGLVTSAILALSAVGFTLQFGVSNIFNLAYGDVMTVSAFMAYVVDAAGAGIWLAMLAGAATGAVVSVAISRLVFTPFLRRGTSRFAMVMVSLALAVILQNAIQVVAGTSFRSYAESQGRSLHFLGMILTRYQLVIIGVAAASMLALHLVLRYTRMGKALRATAADPELARGCGVATDRVSAMAWAISGALCGLAGVVLVMNVTAFTDTTGSQFLIPIVAVAVLGGIGQPYGAMLGALVIGIASELAAAVISPDYKNVVAFVILVIVLLARPQGILSEIATRKEVAA
jgi:branched-chain amino acid transport system permease protein/neutral amino acid transport system permease protein